MSDLLKQAIADAKAVRETALQNAKIALEEAFTPQLKNMLSAKLKEDEMGDDEEMSMEDDEMGDEEVPMEDDEMDMGEEEPEEGMSYEDDEFGDEEGDETEEGVGDIASKLGEPETEADEGGEEEEDSLDLESVIKELESELSEEDDAYPEEVDDLQEEDDAYDEDVEGKEDPKHVGGDMGESVYDASNLIEGEDDEDEEEIEEQSDSSKIGSGDNKGDYADSGDEEDPGKSGQFTKVKMESVQAELKEYKEAVKFLKDKLHEVNILNAKLLFTNKLFKEFALNNNQKLKVVENFDRAQTTREIKLVYATLCESFGDNQSINRKSINESASAKSGTTKPSKVSRKVITEENKVADRFRKLAGLDK